MPFVSALAILAERFWELPAAAALARQLPSADEACAGHVTRILM